VRPTVVQGDKAAPDIVDAIRQFNEHNVADVLIVGRGGGSLEDLWAFNEEPVVRAIVGSRIPVISAVGHEIDFTLADFAADLRAPTPSAAAEIVVPDIREVRQFVAGAYRELGESLRTQVDRAAERFQRAWSPDVMRRIYDRIDRRSQDVDRMAEAIGRRAERIVQSRVSRFRSHVGTLQALSPLRVLARGFAVAEREDGSLILDASDVSPKDRFRVRLHQGIILGIVDSRLGS
jgi:exodeoxyribonuclease VII large subunit